MVSSLHSLSSTFSCLNPLSTLTYLKTLKQHRKQLITCSSLASKSHCSRSTKSILPKSSEQDLVVLGIETSCDDTAAAVVRSNGEILSQVVSSQADLLVRFGGVAPKMAEEAHSQAIDQVVQEALDKANLTPRDLSAVAVTIGPGLSLCLRVGVRKARKVAGSFNLPIVGVHHMEAHALVVRLTERELQFPFLVLLVSGGHNLLILAHGLGQYLQLGTTIDDAVGEAYDKSAKWLGLDISKSGGPAIEQLAREGDAESIKFSVPMRHHKDCNFSYAGLKNQVRLAIESKKINAEIPISSASSQDRSSRADIAASFQRVAVLHLEDRCKRAIDWALKIEPSIKHLVVSGGVASNQYVRARLNEVVKKNNLQLVCPPPSLCTDNGVMVAWTGIEHFRMGRFDPPPPKDEPEDFVYDLRPRWPLGEEHTEGRSEARSMRTARIHPSLTSIIQQGSMQSSSSRHSNHRRSSVSYQRLLHNGPDTIEELLDRHVVKKEKSLDDEEEELLNRRRIATTRREALSLYRDILRATRFFIWPDSRGVLWRDVLRDNARKEFDAARFETDPEIITRLLIGGRDAVQSALDKLAEKHRQQIDKERGGGDRR